MGIFNFHKKNDPAASAKDGFYHIDLHSHLIPGIDDGVKSMEEALGIISSLIGLGIKKVITTPHISQLYPNSPEQVHRAFELLKNKVAEKNMDIQLEVAAEYMVDDGFRELFESGNLLTFGNNFVLIELSTYSPHPGFSDLLFELQSNGYNVVLAHPERYLFWQKDLAAIKKLKDRELYFQLNILSLTKIYSAEIHKMAVQLIKERMIDFIGSDIHNPDYIPLIKNAAQGKLYQELSVSGQIKNNRLLG